MNNTRRYIFVFLILISVFIPTLARRKASATSRAQGRKRRVRGGDEVAVDFACGFRKSEWPNLNNQTLQDLYPAPIRAVAILRSAKRGINDIRGKVIFYQYRYGGPSKITVDISPLIPYKPSGVYVTIYGRTGFSCASAGGHFNPSNVSHANGRSCVKHVGDYGAVTPDEAGEGASYFYETKTQLLGPTSIIGRSVIVTVLEDDKTEDSLRFACGTIGWADLSNLTTSKEDIDRVTVFVPTELDFFTVSMAEALSCIIVSTVLFYCCVWYEYGRLTRRTRPPPAYLFGDANRVVRELAAEQRISVGGRPPLDYCLQMSNIMRENKLQWNYRLQYGKRIELKQKTEVQRLNALAQKDLHWAGQATSIMNSYTPDNVSLAGSPHTRSTKTDSQSVKSYRS